MEGSHTIATVFLILWALVALHSPIAESLNNIVVSEYGAKADGVTDNSPAFLKAWREACSSTEEATIYVPAGHYLVHPTAFSGPCANDNITLVVDGGRLVARTEAKGYSESAYWLMFESVRGLTFKGGYLDGKGSSLWSCKGEDGECPSGATTLLFRNSSDLVLTNITSVDSELFHIVIDICRNVTMEGLKILAAGTSPNTDGIHVEESRWVTIMNSDIGTGDDCISVGPGTEDLLIEQVNCGPGHGISKDRSAYEYGVGLEANLQWVAEARIYGEREEGIGSLGKSANEAGVRNVQVRNVVMTGTLNGLRIKAWARSSTGFAQALVFDGATMNNVQHPIIIDQRYCPHDGQDCSDDQDSGVKISHVTYTNISGTSATDIAVELKCSASSWCQGINMADVQLTYNGHPSTALCQNAVGTASGMMLPPSCLQSLDTLNVLH
ncbi:Polygalacturonase [Nymphaea thermarum]|nr:Polygalacturonase [Nymphaea thermarum]